MCGCGGGRPPPPLRYAWGEERRGGDRERVWVSGIERGGGGVGGVCESERWKRRDGEEKRWRREGVRGKRNTWKWRKKWGKKGRNAPTPSSAVNPSLPLAALS
ncbi:MAG: hypothetical protein ACKESB_00300 [Candidatus Hodgkinia cicadicola]